LLLFLVYQSNKSNTKILWGFFCVGMQCSKFCAAQQLCSIKELRATKKTVRKYVPWITRIVR